MNLVMYCKEFIDRPENERWLGVVVDIDGENECGEILDVMFSQNYDGLKRKFKKYESGE